MTTQVEYALKELHPFFYGPAYRFVLSLEDARIDYIISSAYRSFEKQQELYDELGPAKAAAPGTSYHEKGRALDLVIKNDTQRGEALAIAKRFGFWTREYEETKHVHVDDRFSQANYREPTPENRVYIRDASHTPDNTLLYLFSGVGIFFLGKWVWEKYRTKSPILQRSNEPW